MTALPAPSRTGVRIAGDMFQWLFVWQGCVRVLRDAQLHTPNPVVKVGVEVDGVGNLDDVVLYRAAPPNDYAQVKYAVDSQTPVGEEYLFAPSSTNGPSVVAKVFQIWQSLVTEEKPFQLRLISNRSPDAADPLVALRDSRTQLLLPRAGLNGPVSRAGRARRRWAAALGTTEGELLRFLGDLRLDIARDPQHVLDLVEHLMFAAGLRHDEKAASDGINWVARQVRDGHRHLDHAMIRHAAEDLDLNRGPARAILSIATLKPDPLKEEADHALDWTTRFHGDTPFSKRRPEPPASWVQLQADIEDAPNRLPRDATAIAITGSIRLAPAFLTGTSFRMVTGIDLGVLQRGRLWSTTEPYDAPLVPQQDDITIDEGHDLAVAMAVAADLAADVEDFVRAHTIPVGRLLVLRPPNGTSDGAVPDAATANALAVGMRDAVRRACRGAPHIHLFLAAPMGLALMLGHRWNRLRPTTVYEDVDTEAVYEPAFVVSA